MKGITVYMGDTIRKYELATHVYKVEDTFVVADGGPETQHKNKVFAMIPDVTPCIIQNDTACEVSQKADSKKGPPPRPKV